MVKLKFEVKFSDHFSFLLKECYQTIVYGNAITKRSICWHFGMKRTIDLIVLSLYVLGGVQEEKEWMFSLFLSLLCLFLYFLILHEGKLVYKIGKIYLLKMVICIARGHFLSTLMPQMNLSDKMMQEIV